PPILLAERDERRPKPRLGPAAPSGAWIVARTAPGSPEPSFGLWPARRDAKPVFADRPGTPLSWTADGGLLLATDPATPTTLLALEPTFGNTTTLLTITQGTLAGAFWPRTGPILLAHERDGDLLVSTYRGPDNRMVLARLPGRTLVPGSFSISPDATTLALLASDPTSPTLELHRIDVQSGQQLLLDQSAVVTGTPGLVWSPQGQLFYDLGTGLRLYDASLNIISPLGLGARPLAWSGQSLLARLSDTGGLVRWTNGALLPFANNGSQVIVDDALPLIGGDALTIDGQLWLVDLP
ncbi:MAG TPA: hypothetical protein VGE07_14405, partial [Herpetosiphonaceae bacterium]